MLYKSTPHAYNKSVVKCKKLRHSQLNGAVYRQRNNFQEFYYRRREIYIFEFRHYLLNEAKIANINTLSNQLQKFSVSFN